MTWDCSPLWPQGAPTLLAEPEWEDRVGEGEERTLHGGVHRLPTERHIRKDSMAQWKLSSFFSGKDRRRVDKKSVERAGTDSTKACLGRKMQPGAGRCHLRLEQENELDSRSPVNDY